MSFNKDFETIIDNLLEQVLREYPLERRKEIIERSNAVWNKKPAKDRISYIYSLKYPAKGLPDLPEGISPDENVLATQLQCILNHSEWKDDFFPGLSPGIRQNTIPSYFGCIVEKSSASSKVKPIIHNPKDVYHLPEIGFIPGTTGGDMLARMRYYRKRTRGLLPVFETDMQGPFSVASQIWGIQDFLLAVYDYPKEVHYLLQKCTDVIIKYFKLMFDTVEGDLIPIHCFPLMWFPREKGVAVSEDLTAVVSPEIFREFIRPYLEQIAAEFGGVLMHSCGSISHAVGELNKVKGMVGLNFSTCETDLESLAEEVNPDYIIITHNGPITRPDLPLLNQIEHIELCKKVFAKGRVNGVCIVNPWYAEPEAWRDAEAYRKAASF